ncbi:hypothetical protein I551_0159 [Mycobacterium ulcerans str. Harvey]|uniref:Uncharacterized protein n=1 Tax=Mycobacterium ulcerans str. Harvey TaxID=1299332 RepID=A0ABN0R8G7_MYCUL|nr:hypothetical protein I551_0159 [Mycobacterium ulcerans str. Harvey]
MVTRHVRNHALESSPAGRRRIALPSYLGYGSEQHKTRWRPLAATGDIAC